MNIDRFRAFNEFLNNDSGDELLKQFAQRLRLININAILVAYLNSDDFAIIYEISPIHPNVEQYCQNILQALNAPFTLIITNILLLHLLVLHVFLNMADKLIISTIMQSKLFARQNV